MTTFLTIYVLYTNYYSANYSSLLQVVDNLFTDLLQVARFLHVHKISEQNMKVTSLILQEIPPPGSYDVRKSYDRTQGMHT